ncbi:MAG: hypothetical protein WBI37_10110 [Tepidanaerobacteraceae bacterium]
MKFVLLIGFSPEFRLQAAIHATIIKAAIISLKTFLFSRVMIPPFPPPEKFAFFGILL